MERRDRTRNDSPWYSKLVKLALSRKRCWKELLDVLKENDAEFNSGGCMGFLFDHHEELSLKQEKLGYLFTNGFDPNLRNLNGDTCVHRILNSGLRSEIMLPMIKQFLDGGLDVNAANQEGNTLLHQAIKKGDIEIVAYLIGQGANINEPNNDKQTPLHFAAAGYPEKTRLLVDTVLM